MSELARVPYAELPGNLVGGTLNAMVQARSNTRADTLPAGWLRMSVPRRPDGSGSADKEAIDQARANGAVVDITSSPAYWGQFLREDDLVMVCGGRDLKHAPDESTAVGLVQAHLIQCLSAIGRHYLDFYFLDVDEHLGQDVVRGAMLALTGAIQEGNIRRLGITSANAEDLAIKIWKDHPVFTAALLTYPDSQLESVAASDSATLVATYEGPHQMLAGHSETGP